MNVHVIEHNGYHIEIGRVPTLWYFDSKFCDKYWVTIDNDLADTIDIRRNDDDNDFIDGPYDTLAEARRVTIELLDQIDNGG